MKKLKPFFATTAVEMTTKIPSRQSYSRMVNVSTERNKNRQIKTEKCSILGFSEAATGDVL